MSTVVVTRRVAPARPVPARPVRRARPAVGRGAAGSTPGLRLTARGRLVVGVVVAVLLAMVVAAAVLLGGGSASAGGQGGAAAVTYRVVMPGETLWGIATQVAPGADPRDVVAEIVELNGLPGSSVAAGTRLALPVVH